MGHPKHIQDKAWQLMAQQRDRVRQESLVFHEKAYRCAPKIRDIEREMAGASALATKAVISDPENAQELILKLGERNLKLQKQIQSLLQSCSLPIDCLEEKYFCPKCKDQGYSEGKICECFSRILEAVAYSALSRSAPAKNCIFENFSLGNYPSEPFGGTGIRPREHMKSIFEYCKRYAKAFSLESESLLMMGSTGLGKTHLSLSIASKVLEEGFGVIYTPVQNLMDTLESEKFSRESGAKESYIENTRLTLSCDLLVLDDLGTEFATSFSNSVLYNIINTRLIESRPTIISTNMRISEIEAKYSQRIVSRLICGYRVMEFFGKDIRMIKLAGGIKE